MSDKKLIDDLSNPLEGLRTELVRLVETMTRIRRVVKHPPRDEIFPDVSRADDTEQFAKETAELMTAREDFEEHASNFLARLRECRAHAALASQSLAKLIELSQPRVSKEDMS